MNNGTSSRQLQDNYKTLKEALNDVYTMERLKPLAKKIGKKAPLRKAELIEHITSITFKTLKDIISKMKPITGISHDLIVVTRNIKDMKISGVDLFNPWS